MPVWREGRLRKRWRYVGFYGAEIMLCAARAQIGPFTQCFWGLWDREADRSYEHTRMLPGGREVVLDGSVAEIHHGPVEVQLRLGEGLPIESICASGDAGGWGWTRKLAGVPMRGSVSIAGRRRAVEGFGVDDQSAGYHQRDTAWMWSAGTTRPKVRVPVG